MITVQSFSRRHLIVTLMAQLLFSHIIKIKKRPVSLEQSPSVGDVRLIEGWYLSDDDLACLNYNVAGSNVKSIDLVNRRS